ncbi:Exonuclease 1, partial [Paramuricea clavata]
AEVCAVDVSCWLHKALAVSYKEFGDDRRQRSKYRENATYFTILGDEIAACKESLGKSCRKLIVICCERDIPYIMAPYEADAQITFLVNKGYADFTVSEDSDLLAYQCKKVLFKLETNGTDKFTDMCIAAGCDYLDNIRGIGINKAKKIVSENETYLNVLQTLKFAPAAYSKCFEQARMVFHFQTVIDPSICETVPLTNGDTIVA